MERTEYHDSLPNPEEWLPCPFCGKKPDGYGGQYGIWAVRHECKIAGLISIHGTLRDVLKKWNTRKGEKDGSTTD